MEIGILVFLVLAFGYWATLWIMGRRDDVLHGQFVEFEGEDELAPAMAAPLGSATVPTMALVVSPCAETRSVNCARQATAVRMRVSRATTLLTMVSYYLII